MLSSLLLCRWGGWVGVCWGGGWGKNTIENICSEGSRWATAVSSFHDFYLADLTGPWERDRSDMHVCPDCSACMSHTWRKIVVPQCSSCVDQYSMLSDNVLFVATYGFVKSLLQLTFVRIGLIFVFCRTSYRGHRVLTYLLSLLWWSWWSSSLLLSSSLVAKIYNIM